MSQEYEGVGGPYIGRMDDEMAALRDEIDVLAKRRREIDTAIQAANWAMELPE